MGVVRACAASADVVVIGGGVIGMSAAYHLSRTDPTRRITIIERGQLGNGATHKSAGMMVSLSGCPYKIRMASDTLRDIKTLGRLGIDVGFHQVGTLRVAATKQRAAELANEVRLAQEVRVTF
mmetsp:Transcript_35354/g.94739  ORF Transcript_35354/g.94739 Transcript_35354/m.94739 type:complete len:123 (-) Transcript_35354:117-485(-)